MPLVFFIGLGLILLVGVSELPTSAEHLGPVGFVTAVAIGIGIALWAEYGR